MSPKAEDFGMGPVGDSGRVIGMNTFGASTTLKELQKKSGFEPDQVVAALKQKLMKG